MPSKPPKHIQIIVTIGPATATEEDLVRMKARGVDFVRLNMSHSSTDELKAAIARAKKVGIPFIVDTEGSQVRTGPLVEKRLAFAAGEEVRLYREPVQGTLKKLTLTPSTVIDALVPGDLLYCDFDGLALGVKDTSSKSGGYITARVVTAGTLGSNKGVYVDTAGRVSLELPTLTAKDEESIAIGLAEGVTHVAASFMRSGAAVEEVRRLSKGTMQIISKVECIDGLMHLDEIIAASDAILIDRGDLSKEIFLHRIPFTQKIIVHRARKAGKPVIVATNFLESMVVNASPTRAEVHDIESSITDGAAGLTLAAETAIGAYPHLAIETMQQVIRHVTGAIDVDRYASKEEELVDYLESTNYLLDFANHSSLIAPHGGRLVERFHPELLATLDPKLPTITLDDKQEMDAEQIALGAFSPLEGFMSEKELTSVLDTMHLPSGLLWPIPIVLTVTEAEGEPLTMGSDVLLKDTHGNPYALLQLTEKYAFNAKDYAQKLYGTLDEAHPGVAAAFLMGTVALAGTVDLLARRPSETEAYELTPRQTRRLFESLGWSRVVGFHTRNVIHRSHEFLQLKAIDRAFADGLFVHPVIGKKKKGDFNAPYIVKSYELMTKHFYPPNKAVFATFGSYSRYAGPKEALFTALVRQNYGCSHFIVGRDHTGVGSFYAPTASHDIFDQFPDLLITPVRFNQVFYSEKLGEHVHESDDHAHKENEKLHISGTEARKLFEKGEVPPAWFMRSEIATMIKDAIKRGEEVFVK